MTLQISRACGLVALVAAVVAFCAQVYAIALPYRISFLQERILMAAFPTELVALAIAFVAGIVATKAGHGLPGARHRFGWAAVILAGIVIVMAVLTNSVHSSSYR
jgi:membrane protease YdiL (CAAX protease family)